MKAKRNLVNCYREAGREVVAAGLGVYIPDRPQALFGKPADYIEAAIVSHLAGTVSVKFWHDPEWILGKDNPTYAAAVPLLLHLCPGDEQARKQKFKELFQAAAACVRHVGNYIQAAALALEENPEMGRGELRRLARSFFEEPAGRGETCFGCGGRGWFNE